MRQLLEPITQACDHLRFQQNPEGFWVYDLEADATIPAEYILLQRFLGRPMDSGLKEGLARYLRRRQLQNGGWPLFEGGSADISATVKSYFALKVMGDPQDVEHMAKARLLVLGQGGAARCNVFTRGTLALFGQVPWRTTPAMPIEIMLLPRWFFFHLDKVSYWSRTVIVPLLILYLKQPVCRLQPEETVLELFLGPPEKLRHIDRFSPGNHRKNVFIFLDRLLKLFQPFSPPVLRRRGLRRATNWTLDRMQGEGGIGAIFPAMANAVMALKVLGYPEDHPDFVRGVRAVENLVRLRGDEAFCEPCNSPVWSTSLSVIALLEAGFPRDHKVIKAAVEWLFKKQIMVRGDWSRRVPELEPGGWAFQFENTFYPDIDDTAMVVMASLRAGCLKTTHYRRRIAKALNWVIGMQSSDGGWGAFDVDNRSLYLNDIPFADHGALLDPSTPDVTGRCLELLSMIGYPGESRAVARALTFLRDRQESFGAWRGRWGVNYIYGTWSVLTALRQARQDPSQPYIRKAVRWLESIQNPDGGWGESCESYQSPLLAGKGCSTPSQSAWALLGLMAAGEARSHAVKSGIRYLVESRTGRGGWDETSYTGTGFPRVFYLRYHGYSQHFPLWALGVYRRLNKGEETLQDEIRLTLPPDLPLPAMGW